MAGRQVLFAFVWAAAIVPCLSGDAQFVIYGGNLLGNSYYYQLQLTSNNTVILELRSGDLLSTRADLDATIAEVRKQASKDESWKGLTQFDGDLVDGSGNLIGRLNCQFRSWTCEEDRAMVMKMAASAEIVDRAYVGDRSPQFQISKNQLGSPVTYEFSLKVKDSVLLESPQYPTVSAAKASIVAIQTGKYSFKSVTEKVGPVMRRTIEVLADQSGQTLAKLNIEMGLDLTTAQAYVEEYAPRAHVDESDTLVSAASNAHFVIYGGNLLGPSYYYQLQLQNGTVILELRGGDLLATRESLDATIAEVRQQASKDKNWKDVTQFDGSLVSENGGLIGRLNCQFRSWTCEEDRAMVIKVATGAEVVDRTYIGDLRPRFQISQDDLSSPASYDFSLKVKDSVLLTSNQHATIAAAKASIAAIQTGKYAFKSEVLPMGPVAHRTIEVLADSSGQTLAVVNVEMGLELTSVQDYVKRYAPRAHIDEPAMLVLV